MADGRLWLLPLAFQSAPQQRRGDPRPEAGPGDGSLDAVSIRSPARRGDPLASVSLPMTSGNWFQSAPQHAGEIHGAGDVGLLHGLLVSIRSPARRGDPPGEVEDRLDPVVLAVSIRSPARRGDPPPRTPLVLGIIRSFQSAPQHAGEIHLLRLHGPGGWYGSFNPLPSTPGRSTSAVREGLAGALTGFQSAPQHAGEIHRPLRNVLLRRVLLAYSRAVVFSGSDCKEETSRAHCGPTA